jgi:DHA1 family multidrug resistance protein-like MFS transporter
VVSMDEGQGFLRRNVLVMIVGNTITVSANSLWIMFMPYFFADVGITPFFIGMIFTAIAVSRAVTSLIGGRAADRFGRKPVISLGLLIYTGGSLVILASLIFALTMPSLTGSLAAIGYMCMTAGGGFQGPASSMLLVESSPERRRGLSYMITSRVIPSIPPAALVLVGSSLYLNNQFWLALTLGFFGLLSVLVLFSVGLRETHSGMEEKQAESLISRHFRFDWFLILFITAFALDGISSSGLSWYVPIFVGRSNLDLYGAMISVSTLVIAVSALVSGGFVDKIGTRAAIFGGWTLLAVTVFLFPFGTQPLEILVLYSIWAGLDMMDVSVPPLAVAERYPKEKRASILGAYSMSISLLGMAGPALISFSLLLGENVPFYLKAIMNLTGAFLFLLAFKTRKNGDVTS